MGRLGWKVGACVENRRVANGREVAGVQRGAVHLSVLKGLRGVAHKTISKDKDHSRQQKCHMMLEGNPPLIPDSTTLPPTRFLLHRVLQHPEIKTSRRRTHSCFPQQGRRNSEDILTFQTVRYPQSSDNFHTYLLLCLLM